MARPSGRSAPTRRSMRATGWCSRAIVSTIIDLEKIPGLVPAADARYEVSPAKQRGRTLCEAVISPSSPLVNQTVREADFRALYDAAVVAVHRNGARLTNKVGDIELLRRRYAPAPGWPGFHEGLPQQPRLLLGQRCRGFATRAV